MVDIVRRSALIVLVGLLACFSVGLSSDPVYFLSVMVYSHFQHYHIAEFVRHYLEEGVDHFFLLDRSSNGSVKRQLNCLDRKYYTPIYKNELTSKHSHDRFDAMYQMVRNLSEWVLVIEIDDFIASRSHPELTIKQLLRTQYSDCSAVPVPQLHYSWGDTQNYPFNQVRNLLTYRWGVDDKFAYPGVSIYEKFCNINECVDNKVIFRGDRINKVTLNYVYIRPTKGTVCIPYNGTRFGCSNIRYGKELTHPVNVGDVPYIDKKTEVRMLNYTAHPVNPRGQFCPSRQRFIAGHSEKHIRLLETDIPKLQLAAHKYRVTSQHDWLARVKLDPKHYNNETLANRRDIVDDFMSKVRTPARINHPQQLLAASAMKNCLADVT